MYGNRLLPNCGIRLWPCGTNFFMTWDMLIDADLEEQGNYTAPKIWHDKTEDITK